MTDARRLQALEKETLLQEQAIQDRDEFQKIIETQKQAREVEVQALHERAQRVASVEQRRDNAVELKKQIAIKEEMDKLQFRQKFEAGKKVRDMLTSNKKTLEKIKQEKLALMRELGIPEKYQVDLAKLEV